MKIAIAVGHGRNKHREYDPGVCKNGLEEFIVCKSIYGYLTTLISSKIPKIELIKVPIQNLFDKVEYINKRKPDIAVELHLNSSVFKFVNGVEVLYHPDSERAMLCANIFSKIISEKLYLRNRGAKARKNLYFLNKTICPAIIIESGFISNPDFALEIKNGAMIRNIALAINNAISNIFTLVQH